MLGTPAIHPSGRRARSGPAADRTISAWDIRPIAGQGERMARTKGTTLVGAVRFLRSRKERARELLPSGLHHYLDGRIQESSWYPEEDLVGLLEAMLPLMPGEREDVLREMGVQSARDHLDGVYRHLRFDSIDAIPRRAVALWGSQHDTGRFDVATTAAGEVVMTVRDFGHPSETLCGILGGYFVETIRMTGATNVVGAKQACVVRGDTECVWRITYDGAGGQPGPARSAARASRSPA